MELIDYYDRDKWGTTFGKRVLLQREKSALNMIARLPKKTKTVLDVGCGDGFFLANVAGILGKRSDLHGVDYSRYELRRAKKLPYTFKWANIEETGLPYKDRTFDLVYAAELLEHLVNPDFFLQECRRVLKPGGYLIISTPNSMAWYNRILVLFGIQPLFYELSTKSSQIGSGLLKPIKRGKVPVGHIRIFNVRALRDIMASEGFRVLRVRGSNFQALPKPLLWLDSIVALYPRLASNLDVLSQKN